MRQPQPRRVSHRFSFLTERAITPPRSSYLIHQITPLKIYPDTSPLLRRPSHQHTMPSYACQTCGRPFVRSSPRDRRCSDHRTRDRSPSSLAAEASEYRRNRTKLLVSHPRCHWCGQPATTADHLEPVAHGGGNELGNLVPACARCNYARQAKKGGDSIMRNQVATSPSSGSWRAPPVPVL